MKESDEVAINYEELKFLRANAIARRKCTSAKIKLYGTSGK